jgi:hypothetical protein
MIASVIPRSIPTHTLPVFMPSDGNMEEYRLYSPLLLGCLNSLAYDFFVRMRLQTAHMSFYVVEEAPIVPLDWYSSVDLPFDVTMLIGGHLNTRLFLLRMLRSVVEAKILKLHPH